MDNYSFKELCQNTIYQTRKSQFKTIQICPIMVCYNMYNVVNKMS